MEHRPAPYRLEAIDLLRGIALVAMAVYHFAWDLEFFGYSTAGTTAVGGWKIFARSIASTFLVLVGISLFLAYRGGMRWPGYRRRLAMIVGAAALITAATYVATPDMFIFFGILHQIAFASIAALLFLKLPWPAVLIAAAAVIALPVWFRSSAFDASWLWWTGLSEVRPRSSDFVPVFPWFGAVLVGIALAKLGDRTGALARLASLAPGAWSRPLQFAGRHSLAVYLIHQPVLIGMLWLFSQLWPAPVPSPEARFVPACERSCGEERDEPFCRTYCRCMVSEIGANGLMADVLSNSQDAALRARLRDLAGLCTISAEARMDAGGGSQR